MAKKEFTYRGKKLDELKKLSIKEFAQLVKANPRRTLIRGLTEQQKIFLEKIRKGEKKLKTHCRDMVILPEMVNKTIMIHNGKAFVAILIKPEMLGHRLGEFALTRKSISHSAPGVGATRSSASVSVK
jgi:small subunit ribosomal protein S19